MCRPNEVMLCFALRAFIIYHLVSLEVNYVSAAIKWSRLQPSQWFEVDDNYITAIIIVNTSKLKTIYITLIQSHLVTSLPMHSIVAYCTISQINVWCIFRLLLCPPVSFCSCFAQCLYSLCSSSHQAEHHQQVQPGPVCEQVWSASLVWDQWTGTNWRVSISAKSTFPLYLFLWEFTDLFFLRNRYIPAVVDHTGGLPCHGTYLLHQVTHCLPVYQLFLLTGAGSCPDSCSSLV